MIEYRKGNLLAVKEGVIAHGVNCQGVMGGGVALAIRKMYPVVYKEYQERLNETRKLYEREFPSSTFETQQFLGHVQFVSTTQVDLSYNPPLVIANCFTQDFYGTDERHVDYEAVAQCFAVLNQRVKLYTDKPLNIPKIGAGLAGGDWNVISAIIESEYKGDIVCWEIP
jgi:O-acetyl-ADP-ribose deacetylase (regulator of RNase III)